MKWLLVLAFVTIALSWLVTLVLVALLLFTPKFQP